MPETTETSFESDAFLKLLTDALRAGPASPEWREAVNRLRETGSAESDEYRLLIGARENLESGREYRSVRAGPEFTRKVMQEIEQESQGTSARAGPTSALLIAALGGILAVAVIVIIVIMRGAGTPGTIGELAGTYFTRSAVSSEFSENIGTEWRAFGQPPEIHAGHNGMRGGVVKSVSDYQVGGVFLPNGLGAGDAFSFVTTVQLIKDDSPPILQLFVSNQAAPDQKASGSEFVCYLKDGQFSVAKPDGSVQPRSVGVKELNHVTIKMDSQFAIVEIDGVQIYAGPHGLKQVTRYPGIRFLTMGTEKNAESVLVQSAKILRP